MVLALASLASAWLTSSWWARAIAQSLVCPSTAAISDAILVENFDPDYRIFEHARQMRAAGYARRVLVPVPLDSDSPDVNPVALATTDMLAKLSRLGEYEVVPIQQTEPISLNAARDIQRFVRTNHIQSLLVVSPLFRSRRSELVYGATLGRAGTIVRCEPVRDPRERGAWTGSWHGVQDVAEQWAKLQYYRAYVLRFKLGVNMRADGNGG